MIQVAHQKREFCNIQCASNNHGGLPLALRTCGSTSPEKILLSHHKSVLTTSITVWLPSAYLICKTRLHQVVHSAEKIIDFEVTKIKDLYPIRAKKEGRMFPFFNTLA